MTKPKGGSFAGAWMNGRVPDDRIRARLANEVGAKIEAAPVVDELSRQMEIWRFDLAWRDAEPQPAQWADRLREIVVSDLPTIDEVETAARKVRALPKHVLAVLDSALFKQREYGHVELLRRMAESPKKADAALLRSVLASMLDALAFVKGKRGPRADVGPPLRAIVTVLREHSEMKPVAARELAADLLRLIGIPAPESRGRLSELMKG